jgi:hypothetical protein
MLRRAIRRSTGTINIAKSFTHGLGSIPETWHLTSFGTGRGAGRFRVTAIGTNTGGLSFWFGLNTVGQLSIAS